MQVSELMTPNPYCLDQNDSVLRAAQEMKKHNLGALAVCDNRRLSGIITDRDIVVSCVAGGHHPEDCKILEHMTANPISVSPDTSIQEALRRMGREQVRRLCVMDGDEIAGIVSLGDLAVRMADDIALAQTLGQISQPVRTPQPVA